MTETTAAVDLPTPAQMRNFYAVSRAAWQALRLGEASRALLTGNLAFGLCMIGTILVLLHSLWMETIGPWLVCGIVGIQLGSMFFSIIWLRRQRAHSLVRVIDRREEELQKATARPWKVVAVLLAFLVFQGLMVLGWSIAFRHMSEAAILAVMALAPLLGMIFFVRRFVLFQFWEDLLFAASVGLAFVPFLLLSWNLMGLCLLALVLVVVGTVCLQSRWVRWNCLLADKIQEDGAEEGQS